MWNLSLGQSSVRFQLCTRWPYSSLSAKSTADCHNAPCCFHQCISGGRKDTWIINRWCAEGPNKDNHSVQNLPLRPCARVNSDFTESRRGNRHLQLAVQPVPQICLKQFVKLAADMLLTERWEFVFICLPASLLHKPRKKLKKTKRNEKLKKKTKSVTVTQCWFLPPACEGLTQGKKKWKPDFTWLSVPTNFIGAVTEVSPHTSNCLVGAEVVIQLHFHRGLSALGESRSAYEFCCNTNI